eukprot:CAMPEP_0113724136 /NCGR_PEP_ID=MMETSP0038_2-20120614/38875_1 /TAXON_ID=2898 /ORGANISM="Cryptomonas paramecium" /LENGTH=37 /DNA_ID=CAMNT_0000653931 /DNA_START=67 /DNA_END=177 /DNA_ORIENTATION=+ /assembly_acc=CAM_ASM_000170
MTESDLLSQLKQENSLLRHRLEEGRNKIKDLTKKLAS